MILPNFTGESAEINYSQHCRQRGEMNENEKQNLLNGIQPDNVQQECSANFANTRSWLERLLPDSGSRTYSSLLASTDRFNGFVRAWLRQLDALKPLCVSNNGSFTATDSKGDSHYRDLHPLAESPSQQLVVTGTTQCVRLFVVEKAPVAEIQRQDSDLAKRLRNRRIVISSLGFCQLASQPPLFGWIFLCSPLKRPACPSLAVESQ